MINQLIKKKIKQNQKKKPTADQTVKELTKQWEEFTSR